MLSPLPLPGRRDIPPGHTLDPQDDEILPLYCVANRFAERGWSSVVVAGHRYGAGSSRDWAAKGLALLGVQAVLANSFERIHRTNLINMGVLPLRLPGSVTPATLGLSARHRIVIDAPIEGISPRCEVVASIVGPDGSELTLATRADIETELETGLLGSGGLVPMIIERLRRQHADGRRLAGGMEAPRQEGAEGAH